MNKFNFIGYLINDTSGIFSPNFSTYYTHFCEKPLKNTNKAIYCRIAKGIVANIMPPGQTAPM